jgi:hypothetical protein
VPLSGGHKLRIAVICAVKASVAPMVRLVFQGGLGPGDARYFRNGGLRSAVPEVFALLGGPTSVMLGLVQVGVITLVADKERSVVLSNQGLPIWPSRLHYRNVMETSNQ